MQSLPLLKINVMESQKKLTDKLNTLLATYQIHYQNLRALHWNVKGANFFELHLKYEELYTRTQIIIDDLAERILTLESIPLHKFQDYLTASTIEENATIFNGNSGMEYILSAQKTLILLEKEILKISADLDDDGTNSMMSDLIREKEKTNWMFTAWLNKK
jgi:starvation-inducible DNA-binding protein